MYKQVALIILDGWGLREERAGNAIKCVPTPHLDWLLSTYPTASLRCSGEAVGLMEGQMGDSNVGHLNIGAGRVVFQDLVRISRALGQGYLKSSEPWNSLCDNLRSRGGRLHIFGLLSDGGVHSHIDHLKAVLRDAHGLEVYLHLQLDGRDVAPTTGATFLRDIEDFLQYQGRGQIATVMGRYYGMDRDQRWDRTEKAYNAMTHGSGELVELPSAAVEAKYNQGITDEFIAPMIVRASQPHGRVRSGDGILYFNFRADRVRQIVQSFDTQAEVAFERRVKPQVDIVTFTRYHQSFPFPYLFGPQDLTGTLGEVVSKAGLRQLRMAETEKYVHVTFFLNGGRDNPYPGEERRLIPSPKVSTYDLQPEMSAPELAKEFVEKLNDGYSLLVLNFANLDMVGHTGVYEAACKAVTAVDTALGQVVRGVLARGGAAIVTADHGNAEYMFDEAGHPCTTHTLNDVGCVLATPENQISLRATGILADIAPTVLELMGLKIPELMTGRSLITGGMKQ